VPRPLFIEEKGLLENLMNPYGRALQMSRHDFQSGQWISSILKVIQMPLPCKIIERKGDVQVCEYIEMLSNS
jgi:hypothetical protein